jgi:hypothetical protein
MLARRAARSLPLMANGNAQVVASGGSALAPPLDCREELGFSARGSVG